MKAISRKDLERLCDRLNLVTQNPATKQNEDGQENFGHFFVGYDSNVIRLWQQGNSGLHKIFTAKTKRQMHELMMAYLGGYSAGFDEAKEKYEPSS